MHGMVCKELLTNLGTRYQTVDVYFFSLLTLWRFLCSMSDSLGLQRILGW